MSNDSNQPAPTKATRLIFEYEGEQVRLVSQHPVEMVVTGHDLVTTEQPGYYVDTHDTAGLRLARVSARNAFAASAEVFPEKAGGPITRVDVAKPRGAFTVVVPAPDHAHEVSVVKVVPSAAGTPAPAGKAVHAHAGHVAIELGRFALNARPQGGRQP
jgi:hypothetical protein